MKCMRNILINYVFIQTLRPSEQNITLHPIIHIIELNHSNQTIISPLSYNPISTSSPQSPHNPVPIKPDRPNNTSNQTQVCVLRETDKNETVDCQHI